MKYHLRLNGRKVSATEFHENGPVGGTGLPMTNKAYSGANPLLSEGLGCMKAQVPEMRQEIRKRNIQGVKVRDSGKLEITSRRGRKQVCKMRGLVDNDGGYVAILSAGV